MPGKPAELKEPFAWCESDDLLWISFEGDAVRGAFSTRHKGLSSGNFDSLNLGFGIGDNDALVSENREKFIDVVNIKRPKLASVKQVHGTKIVDAKTLLNDQVVESGPGHTEADGLVTTERQLSLLVLTADCLPVALVADRAVAMVHCGWRGLTQGIVGMGVASLLESSGKGSEDIAAYIGPGIGECCYEVGEDVKTAVSRRTGSEEFFSDRTRALDLVALTKSELMNEGVRSDYIHAVDICTSCCGENFFSHRRDGGITGRQGGVIWLV